MVATTEFILASQQEKKRGEKNAQHETKIARYNLGHLYRRANNLSIVGGGVGGASTKVLLITNRCCVEIAGNGGCIVLGSN